LLFPRCRTRLNLADVLGSSDRPCGDLGGHGRQIEGFLTGASAAHLNEAPCATGVVASGERVASPTHPVLLEALTFVMLASIPLGENGATIFAWT